MSKTICGFIILGWSEIFILVIKMYQPLLISAEFSDLMKAHGSSFCF